MKSNKRYTIKEVKNILLGLGYYLISDVYINAKTKLIFKDKENYIYTSQLNNLLSGKTPSMVHTNNPYSIDNILQYIVNNKINIILLSKEYEKNNKNLLFKCQCGEEFECSYSKFTTRNKYLCNKCSLKAKGERNRYSVNFIKEQFYKHGLLPLFDSYSSCEENLPCATEEGYKGYLSYSNLKSGYLFGVFKTNNPFLVENINIYTKDKKCTLINERIDDMDEPLYFECECGEEFYTTWKSFTTNDIKSCQRCSHKQSQYSIKTEEFLKEINMEYDTEYSFEDCRHIGLLYFDYAVFIGDTILLIEVDGELHFKIGYGGDKALKSQRQRDKIKNQYCVKNNIILIRIPYWDFNDDSYKNIIMEGIHKLQLSKTR